MPTSRQALWSGRRDSNSRHPAWKAEALPTELLPLMISDLPQPVFRAIFRRAGYPQKALCARRFIEVKGCSCDSDLCGISYIRLAHEDGGGGRIRTSEGFADRFTVCSLWPLGNPTGLIWRSSGGRRSRVPLRTTRLRRPTVSATLMLPVWSQRRDSNPRPTDYKSVALPTELRWPAVSMPVFEFQITHVNRVDICL